jgi:predicted site-specific integrase-resolvase
MRTCSTNEVAEELEVHRITLQRWLANGLVRPSVAVPLKGRTLWRWTRADVANARKVKANQKRGRKPKLKR